MHRRCRRIEINKTRVLAAKLFHGRSPSFLTD
jgi:hypothetical protein